MYLYCPQPPRTRQDFFHLPATLPAHGETKAAAAACTYAVAVPLRRRNPSPEPQSRYLPLPALAILSAVFSAGCKCMRGSGQVRHRLRFSTLNLAAAELQRPSLLPPAHSTAVHPTNRNAPVPSAVPVPELIRLARPLHRPPFAAAAFGNRLRYT